MDQRMGEYECFSLQPITKEFFCGAEAVFEFYCRHFVGKTHRNYIAKKTPYGPVCISFKQGVQELYLVIRSRLAYEAVFLKMGVNSRPRRWSLLAFLKGVFDTRSILNRTLSLLYHPFMGLRFQKQTADNFAERLFLMEKSMIKKNHKVGVLCLKRGQKGLLEAFQNEKKDISFEFKHFLYFLGSECGRPLFFDMAGQGEIGTQISTRIDRREIIFHISNLLAERERQRMIGNNICLIVFNQWRIKLRAAEYFSKQTHLIVEVVPNEGEYQCFFYRKRGILLETKAGGGAAGMRSRTDFLRTMLWAENSILQEDKYRAIAVRVREACLKGLLE
eukprot:GHVN01004688.1.p1 GENE.GHVN01004688.1~~GHVN01004688.1.p1  ORF type:complete len:350 (-),score=28.75 GHVN01004688.1:71-1069(-)